MVLFLIVSKESVLNFIWKYEIVNGIYRKFELLVCRMDDDNGVFMNNVFSVLLLKLFRFIYFYFNVMWDLNFLNENLCWFILGFMFMLWLIILLLF